MNDMTGRELHIGDKVAYIFVPYGKAVAEHGGTGIVTKIDEDKPRPVQVDFGESKNSYVPHKLVILEKTTP
jgi:hypothetical protein